MTIQEVPSAAESGFVQDAWKTYVRAVVHLLPTVFAWSFSLSFLVPKVRQLWGDAGLGGSRVNWVMGISDAVFGYGKYVLVVVVVALVILENLCPGWARYRRAVVDGLLLFFHTAVLAGITALSIGACVAAPLVDKLQ